MPGGTFGWRARICAKLLDGSEMSSRRSSAALSNVVIMSWRRENKGESWRAATTATNECKFPSANRYCRHTSATRIHFS
ncbi:hypothetical protein BCR44DRAFT_1442611 [Catenaria anguillulae PL171]|uniref:Uncharacterized protein n=1 Tax=Catenaria anguillulae PL171 TaxID=765915 RepID=A0A1Y2H9P5_9FUNG|nr:hypothetical protein BCR44DRAFT_1442611 [Catenaria anguillulae PL171]